MEFAAGEADNSLGIVDSAVLEEEGNTAPMARDDQNARHIDMDSAADSKLGQICPDGPGCMRPSRGSRGDTTANAKAALKADAAQQQQQREARAEEASGSLASLACRRRCSRREWTQARALAKQFRQ